MTLSPLPYVERSGDLQNGLLYDAPAFCIACAYRVCVKAYEGPDGQLLQCYKGIKHMKAVSENADAVVWTGFLVKGMPYPHNHKEILRLGIVTISESELENYRMRFSPGGSFFEQISGIRRSAQSQSLHDLTPLITILTRLVERSEIKSAEDAVNPTREQIEALQTLAFQVFQILGAIKNQIDLSDFVIAPDALSYSTKELRSLHGLWYKNMHIYNVLAKQEDKEIVLGPTPAAHDSKIVIPDAFSLVPAILLDNAIKYSASNNAIRITFSEDGGDLVTTVTSFGVVIPEDKREAIWTHGGRVTYSNLAKRPGSGFGLFLVRRICELSGFSISYEAEPTITIRGNPAGYNKFIIRHPRRRG